MASASGGHRTAAPASAARRRDIAGNAIRGAGLRKFCEHAYAARSGGLFAYRTFLAQADYLASRPHAPALSVADRWVGLFQRAIDAGSGGCGVCAGLGSEKRANP